MVNHADLQGNVETGNQREVFSTSVDLTTRRFDDHNRNHFNGTMAKGVRNSAQKSLAQRTESKEKETARKPPLSRRTGTIARVATGHSAWQNQASVDKTKGNPMVIPMEIQTRNTDVEGVNPQRGWIDGIWSIETKREPS